MGCSGGGSGASSDFGPSNCGDPGAFCVVSCNLGCASNLCSITDIAQNQRLVFIFNKAIDPRSVDTSTISLKTATGAEPVGTFLVQEQTITFVPEVRSVQGATFFGFSANENYVLTIQGGSNPAAAVVSTSGDRLVEPFSCNLSVTLGVIDLDAQAPKATLLEPSSPIGVPLDTNVVVEFSEIIDHAPFFGANAQSLPVRFMIRRRKGPGCDLAERSTDLVGAIRLENDTVRSITRLEFRAAANLPGNSCIEVQITSRVVDLAGNPANPQSIPFNLVDRATSEKRIDEVFDNDLKLDKSRSGGEWVNNAASFSFVGGDGRHGDFSLDDANTVVDELEFTYNTSNTLLSDKPSKRAPGDEIVDDGIYYFTNFIVPFGKTVRFVGDNTAQIFVRGICDIQGKVETNGGFVEGGHNGKNSRTRRGDFIHGQGQRGALGGAGGGRGGNGGWTYDGVELPPFANADHNDYAGFPGEDMTVPAGHAYAGNVAGTGGQGSSLFPAAGDPISFNLTGMVSAMTTSGGGGGGFIAPGGDGVITSGGYVVGNPINAPAVPPDPPNPDLGPRAPGGVRLDNDLQPFSVLPAGATPFEHYLVGGAGGGGGGCHALLARENNTLDPLKFRSGGGGAGGAGGIGFSVGRLFALAGGSSVEAIGGTGDQSASGTTLISNGAPAPGGGGSGGSILILANDIDLAGRIDVSGGVGVPMAISGFFRANVSGGNGSPGHVHIETPSGGSSRGVVPAIPGTSSIATLTTRDQFVGCQSLWYPTAELFPPEYLRYEIIASIDGGPDQLFTDDDSQPGSPALLGSAPIAFFVQGADVDPITFEPTAGVEPWRQFVVPPPGSQEVGLSFDATTGFRWAILLDRSMAADAAIKRVSIIWRS